MTDVDGLIDAIVSKNPMVSRDKLLKRLEEERKKSGGLISDEVLLRMVAAEFGVEISHETFTPSTPLIASLVPGLNDVTVVGRVIAVFPAKISDKKNRRVRFASMIVADKSGTMRVVLWNDKAEFADPDKIRVGQIVRFSHGYTKEGRLGHVELHIGEKGEVDANPKGFKADDYPTIKELSTKIGAITNAFKNKRVNLIGEVREIFQESTFERKDKTIGKVARFILADETGEIPVVVWNEKVDEVKEILKKGFKLQVVNAKAKKALNGKMEIHADNETYIDLFKHEKSFQKIANLKEGMKNVNVEGEVITKPILREVKTSRNETVKLAVFEIKDETGRIWVSAWRKNAEKTTNLKLGEKIIIKNAYVKKGFGDQPEISTRNTSAIEILSRTRIKT
ncbi:MAG: OB-fold nucleic acid binding domain-containing protein [Candidatus Bathyarchaeota archaeon]|jgi:replication factor A1|nr:OB-fold nucleic acid binding domain-containing protein [Candidatus Bathyarchaeota archaeon]